MSKNFENEYINLTQTNPPDLWNRIEEGLAPRTVKKLETEPEPKIVQTPETEPEPEVVQVLETEGRSASAQNRKVPERLLFFRKYKAVLTAAVCVILILPAAVILGKTGIGFEKSRTEGIEMMSEAAAEDTEAELQSAVTEEVLPEESAVEEMPESEVGEIAETATLQDMMKENVEAAQKETVEESTEEIAENTLSGSTNGKEMSEELVSDQAVVEEAKTEKEAAEEAAQKERAVGASAFSADFVVSRIDAADGTELDHVIVQVYMLEKASEVGEQGATPAIFRARVLEDAEGLLKEGDEIQIALSPFSSVLWTEEEAVYEVMLEYDSTREYPFYLKGCY